MDIKDLNKKQLILLTLLITFVVSIATGIVTVSLMNQMPPKATQTITNVVQRTIEKVTTLPAVTDNGIKTETTEKEKTFGTNEALVSIYPAPKKNEVSDGKENSSTPEVVLAPEPVKSLGQGIIISDAGLIMVEDNILDDDLNYVVALGQEFFTAKVVKKYGNGFVVLGIITKTDPLVVANESQKDSAKPDEKTPKADDLSASAIKSIPVDKPQQ